MKKIVERSKFPYAKIEINIGRNSVSKTNTPRIKKFIEKILEVKKNE